MTLFEILLFIFSLLIMLVGMAGIFLPIIPSIPLIFISSLIYAIFTGFKSISVSLLIFFAILSIVVFVADYLASIYGAKKFGASKFGLVGAVVGTIVGFFIGNIVGLIFGPLVGVILFEIIAGKDFKNSVKAGFGTFIGYLSGAFLKLAVGSLMISFFFFKVLYG